MKAVFFDANGVLYYREKKSRPLDEFLRKKGLPVPADEELDSVVRGFHDQALRGLFSQEYCDRTVLAACGVTDPKDIKEGLEVLRHEHGNILLFPGLIETLTELKARGFKLGIITDAVVSKETKLAWLRARGLDIAWDAYANSADLGVRKPHLKMYQTAMDQAGVRPGESVFVGHAGHELAGARAAGMLTVAFNYDNDARADWYIDRICDLLDVLFLQSVF